MSNKPLIPLNEDGKDKFIHIEWIIDQHIVQFKVLVIFYVFDFEQGLVMVHGAN